MGVRLRPAARQALTEMAERFYRKVYPPEHERADEQFDFGRETALKDYMRSAQKLLRSRGMVPEYILLARGEIGLYHALQRLGARVQTSRIVRKYLSARPAPARR